MNQRRKPQHYTRKVDGKIQSVNKDVSYNKTNASYSNASNKSEPETQKMDLYENTSDVAKTFVFTGFGVYLVASLPVLVGFSSFITIAPILAVGAGAYMGFKTLKTNLYFNKAIELGFNKKDAHKHSMDLTPVDEMEKKALENLKEQLRTHENINEPEEVIEIPREEAVLKTSILPSITKNTNHRILTPIKKHEFTKIPTNSPSKIYF